MAGRLFRALRWLNRPHGAALRHAAGALASLGVATLTGSKTLAAEVHRLFLDDHFTTGLHRVRWYLSHGWTARIAGGVPLFDPTTDMPDTAVRALDDWLAPRRGLRHRLARLYVLARQIRTADDADAQQALIRTFETLASDLVADMPRPDTRKQPGGKSDPDFTLDQARAALDAMRQLDMPWYIISGTFLGAVREGAFLAHDYDIDIGIQIEDFDANALQHQIAAAPDLALVNHSDHLDMTRRADGLWQGTPVPALYRVLHASGIGVDVFVHHPDGDLRWHGSAKHRWDNSDFDLADVTISGLTVRGPADADRYLTENYGDWRTPVKSFDCSTGTPNVSFPRNPSAIAEHLRIALLPGPAHTVQIARLILWQQGHLRETGDRTAFGLG